MVKNGLYQFLRDLVDAGSLSEANRPRILTSPQGLTTVCHSAWSPEWATPHPVARMQFTFWQSLMLQGVLRNTGLLGLSHEEPLTFEHFTLLVVRTDVGVRLVALIKPRHEKTLTAEGTRHLITSASPRFRDPIFLLLVLARIRGVSPVGLDLNDLEGTLDGSDVREFQFRGDNVHVFDGFNERFWTSVRINPILVRLCAIAGMPAAITTHSYRTIGIHFMNMAGEFSATSDLA